MLVVFTFHPRSMHFLNSGANQRSEEWTFLISVSFCVDLNTKKQHVAVAKYMSDLMLMVTSGRLQLENRVRRNKSAVFDPVISPATLSHL